MLFFNSSLSVNYDIFVDKDYFDIIVFITYIIDVEFSQIKLL